MYKENNEIQGVILVGYFINDTFLENLKKNTNLEIAFIGNSAVMSSTKWGKSDNLDRLPINYLHYQNLRKNNNLFKEIRYGDKSFIITAKELSNMESLVTGSILFGFPYDWIKKEKAFMIQQQLLLFGIIFSLSILIIFIISIKYSKYINNLSDAAVKLSKGKSSEKIHVDTTDELALLADSFNIMSDKLNILHSNMEDEISNKTEELEVLNNNLKEMIKEEVSKNREKDKQLIQQSRMAQMGEMLSMIAHQWRQPLSAISATSASLELKARRNTLDNDTAQNKARNISNYAQHLSSTIDVFRNFFKIHKEKRVTSYDEVVSSVLDIIQASLSDKNIQLIQELHCHDTFNSYPNELKQVVLNLLKNADDVIAEKEIKDPFIKISSYVKDQKYVLEVSDNAGGIPDDIIDKIFDPYFSTKMQKDGTGLGLYMSKTIIEEHCAGSLTVKNREDGAVFTIEIPNEESINA